MSVGPVVTMGILPGGEPYVTAVSLGCIGVTAGEISHLAHRRSLSRQDLDEVAEVINALRAAQEALTLLRKGGAAPSPERGASLVNYPARQSTETQGV